MKKRCLSLVHQWRRILRSVVREYAYQHNPLLINSLAAFNFRPPLIFPDQKLARSSAFPR